MKKPVFINLTVVSKVLKNRALKQRALKLVAALVAVSSFSLASHSEDFRRLEDNISSLKSKIRASQAKDPKDIQKLYRLENELEKKMYLQKNKAR